MTIQQLRDEFYGLIEDLCEVGMWQGELASAITLALDNARGYRS
jgi:hypothetical protein